MRCPHGIPKDKCVLCQAAKRERESALLEPPKDTDPFGPVDFIANIIYQHEGGSVRWGLLKQEIRQTYREKAIETVASWSLEELMASKSGGGG